MEPLVKPIAVETPEFVVRDLDDSKLEAAVHLWENDPAERRSPSRSRTFSARSPRDSRRSSRS